VDLERVELDPAEPGALPAARVSHSMAFDATLGGVVLFGGKTSDQTLHNDAWLWNGSDWSLLTLSGPAPAGRSGQAMSANPASGGIVIFGGDADDPLLGPKFVNDTWILDGTTWRRAQPSRSPDPREDTSMAVNSTTGLAMLFSGYGVSIGDTWTRDGTDWTEQNPPSSPANRIYPAIGFDQPSGRRVMFGGAGSSFFGDTWTLAANPAGVSSAPIVVAGTVAWVGDAWAEIDTPVNANGLIVKVYIEYGPDPSHLQTQFITDLYGGFSDVTVQTQVGNLAPVTTNQYRIIAVSGGGTTSSPRGSFRSAPTSPMAPTDVFATAGNAQAVVSWSAPASDVGSAITEYMVAATPGIGPQPRPEPPQRSSPG
jgi:Galactose oxidase, central domain